MKKNVLEGVKILDASTVLAAPLASSLLADFGAEVIKVEQPNHGDPLRHLGNYWKVTNRNKKNITLDFNQPEAREVFFDLVKECDAVTMNYRPDTLKKWKLDYKELMEAKKNIVMLHFTAFGRTGPYSNRAGFARIAESFAGLTYRTGYPDRKPVFSGYPIADGIGGIYGAYSLMLALYHLKETGEGQLIDLSLYEPIMRMMEDYIIDYDLNSIVKEREGTHNPDIAPNDMYKTKDNKWIVLPVSTQNMFNRLMVAMDRAELLKDPRFKDNSNRVKNREVLDEYVVSFFSNYTATEMISILEKHGLAYGKVNTIEDIFNDAHIKERENIVSIFDEELNKDVAMQGIVPKLSETPGEIKWPGAPKGSHNDEVYKELLGYSQDRIVELKKKNII